MPRWVRHVRAVLCAVCASYVWKCVLCARTLCLLLLLLHLFDGVGGGLTVSTVVVVLLFRFCCGR